MRLSLQPVLPGDAATIAALRNAAAFSLTTLHGRGPWSGQCTERGVLFDMRVGQIFGVRDEGEIVATLQLSPKKPWAIDRTYFTPVARPLYLTAMAVWPELQRQGLGRACLELAADLARRHPADAILLDAFDHPAAGAGGFYRKCGYRETGRVRYRGVPLIYFELLLGPAS